ncbi:MAG TPA: hypothetical protein VFZ65_10665 [Planctomycetota bacterium]|nr:hypothetical protein [Planctomycetota bacterium]
MNAIHLSPLAAAILVACPPAQDASQRLASAVVILQCGATDLVVNQPLLEAIAAEPACHDGLRAALGDAMQRVNSVAIQLPAPHAAGTFQLHLTAQLSMRGPWTGQQQDAAVDAIFAHLQRRLGMLLYEEPKQQLQGRRDELERRHAELLAERDALLARGAAASRHVEALRQQQTALAQQLLAGRIEVATEESGVEQIERLRKEYIERRDQLTSQVAKQDAEQDALHAKLEELEARLATASSGRNGKPDDPAAPGDARELARMLADQRAAWQAFRRTSGAAAAALTDVDHMLTVTLEQLPVSTLSTQRARARLQCLETEQKRVAEQLAQAEDERAAAARSEAEAERLGIDLTVCKTLLIEVQGKLARLQPVRYELLHQR